MCLKEEYKEKRETLETCLSFLKVPRWQWSSSSLLLQTLSILSYFTRYRNSNMTIRLARNLIEDIYPNQEKYE